MNLKACHSYFCAGVVVVIEGSAEEKVDMMKRETEEPSKVRPRIFEVSQAFDIQLPPDRVIVRQECAKQFFQGPARLFKKKIGCYIFSLRTGRGSMPYYVGRTWKSFADEVFQPQKISDHYQKIVARHKGTPTLTFVSLVNCRGPKPETAITELEKYLIKKAHRRNRNLSNRREVPKMRWTIKGVNGVKDRPGAPNKDVSAFKQLLGV